MASMTNQEWLAEVARRTVIDEGDKTVAYPDPLSERAKTGSGPGDPWTIGIGETGSEIHEGTVWTEQQVQERFQAILPRYVAAARASLPNGIFDALSDARRFVVFDLTYNMGPGSDGWGGFGATHALIATAQGLKNRGKLVEAHGYFVKVGQHLTASSWIAQTGNRARRGIAMMVVGDWCKATGNGSDLVA